MAAPCFFVFFILKLTLVAGQSVQYVLKGGEATLSPSLPSAPDDILWKHNGNKAITFDNKEENVFPPFEGRITLAWGTADLTIEDVGFEDSGEYELDAFIRNKLHRSQYMLKVLDKVSKPVIQCEMNEESGNATSGQRATLHCSSDSDTPEALTFKWNLEGKSHLGQALTIALGNEHDHMEYSCTAAHALHAETSVFMAKDCIKEGGPDALEVIVPIVIALLILLAFCIFPIIFRHQIKRACFRPRKSNDVEKQTAGTDSKDEERTSLMGNIHRQETIASNQRLIQQSDFEKETPQKQGFENVMQELRLSKRVKDRAKKFATESQADTQTEEENDTEIVGSASNQPASPITNGLVDSDSERETDLTQKDPRNVRKSEGGSDSDSHYHDAAEETDENRALPDSNPDHEDKTETHVTGDSTSVPSDQDEDQKQAQEDEESAFKQETERDIKPTSTESSPQVSLLHSSDKDAPKENSQTEVAEPKSSGQINSDGESAPDPEVKGQRDASHNDDLAKKESQKSPPQSEPSDSESETVKPNDEEKLSAGEQTNVDPVNEDLYGDSNHESEGKKNENATASANAPSSFPETTGENEEKNSDVKEQKTDPKKEDPQGDSNFEGQVNETENTTGPSDASKLSEATVSLLHPNDKPARENSRTEEVEPENNGQINSDGESAPDPEVKGQRDASHNDDLAKKESQISPPQSEPSESESETVKHNDEDDEKLSAGEQTKVDPVNEDLYGDSNHESEGKKNENATAAANAPSSLPETTGENEEKNSDVKEQKTDPTKEDPSGDSNFEGQVDETENTTVDRGSQSDPNQSPDPAPKVEETKGSEKPDSRTDKEQDDQDSNDKPEGSTQTGTAE